MDSLTRLIAAYEVSPEGEPIEACLQRDWNVFSLDQEKVRQFLSDCIPEHELLADGALVRLRSRDGSQSTDHVASWTAFAQEIRYHNRFFPRSAPEHTLLRDALADLIVPVTTDIPLYRARLKGRDMLGSGDMGAPPPAMARPGRANPVGIPYLYLAFTKQTCIYETRARQGAQLAIATFRPTRELRVIDLADIPAPDFFSLPESDSLDEQLAQIEIPGYIRTLATLLSTPVREDDSDSEYIPTQYLCEFIKSVVGVDGVLYASSLDFGGRNLVLFETDAAVCKSDPEVVKVDRVDFTLTSE